MQKNRLFQIIYYILEKGKVTAPELAEKFEVSIRTIYRDIDVISGAGIPICTSQGKGGGISILDDFVLDKSFFTESEREQIMNALQSISIVDNDKSDDLISKFSALFQRNFTNWIEVDFSDWSQNKPDQEMFERIKTALFEHKQVAFDYFSNEGEKSCRTVQPAKLIFKSKSWYLYGFCLLRKEYRFFKLTRIKALSVQNESYSPVYIPAVMSKQVFDGKLVSVKLKFDQEIAFRVYDEFDGEISKDKDGNLYLQVELPNNDLMFSYIFSYLEHVEVLEPQHIRDKFVAKIAQIENKYGT